MVDLNDFCECPFCDASVKLKNMFEHKFKAHRKEMQTKEGSIRELISDKELEIARDQVSEYLSSNNDRDAADLLRKILKVDPEDFEGWYRLGLCLKELCDQEEALEAFNKSIDIERDFVPALQQKGNLLLQQESEPDSEETRKCFKKVTELDPSVIQGWHNLGIVHQFEDNYEKAIDCFDKAIELNDEYYLAWYAKSKSLRAIGEIEKSEKCMDKVLELNPLFLMEIGAEGNKEGSDKTIQSFTSGMRTKEEQNL